MAKKFRKILNENKEKEFDRAIFESLNESVIVGAYDFEENQSYNSHLCLMQKRSS